MPKLLKSKIYKFILFFTVFSLLINIGESFFNDDEKENINQKQIIKTNSNTFNNTSNILLSKSGVAISTNLGIRYTQQIEIPVTIYKDVFSIQQLINTNANNELIGKNMIIIEEYKNILKTDIKQFLISNNDRLRTLNAFISQLEYRYTLSKENIKTLNKQKNYFNNIMSKNSNNITNIKLKIEKDFVNNKNIESIKNIDDYLQYKKDYLYARTYIIFINHFLVRYNYYNNINKKLLDTLINNKQAIINDIYIVIPDTGIDGLKELNLIKTEQNFKN